MGPASRSERSKEQRQEPSCGNQGLFGGEAITSAFDERTSQALASILGGNTDRYGRSQDGVAAAMRRQLLCAAAADSSMASYSVWLAVRVHYLCFVVVCYARKRRRTDFV